MKKRIFITLLAVVMCQNSFSIETIRQNTVDELFAAFSKENYTSHIKMGSLIMSFANLFTDTKGVLGIEVYSFEECDKSVKEKLNEAIKNLKDNSYETLISTSENGERTKVLIKIKNDIISEIVVATGGNDATLVRIKGKIKSDDVKSVINNNK